MKKNIKQIYEFSFEFDNGRSYLIPIEAQDYATAQEYLKHDLELILKEF